MYNIYLLECADGTLYCGKTTDLERRLSEHNKSKKGAKYTKSRRPVRLVYFERCQSRSKSLKREWQIKKLTRDKKLQLISNFPKDKLDDVE